MHDKCKWSFSVLIISSCLVQYANAIGNKNGELIRVENVGSGGTVSKGFALITNSVPSSNIKIGEGSVEVVDNGAVSVGATIEKGGIQIVTRGGTTINAEILGGKQFVHEENNLDLTGVEKLSSAYDATVNGGEGAVGQQNIYDAATAWKTKVGKDGEQNLYAGLRKEGGKSMYAEISGNGRQHVLALGESYDTTLSDYAVQVVYPGGFIDSLTVKDFAKSWLHIDAEDVVGAVRVNDKGELYLFAGDMTNHITKKRIPIEGRVDETIFLVGERNIKKKAEISIEDLGGEGGTVIFTSIPYDPRHITLYVEKLSGHLHFRFNISAKGDGGDYLLLDSSAGNHKISVSDSGTEITRPLLKDNSLATEIPLITDRGQEANFTLANSSGEEITTVDGGAYMYSLYKREKSSEFGGNYTVWYLGMSTGASERSTINFPRKPQKPKATTFSSPFSSRVSSRSSLRGSSGGRNGKPQPKPRPPRHLRGGQQVFIPSSLLSSPEHISVSADHHYHLAEHQQAVVSSDAQFLADHTILRPSDQRQSHLQSRKEMSVSHFLTTPSTDAILSLSVAPAMVFHNEIQTVRAGERRLDRSKHNKAFWTYGIKNKKNITADHINFKLEQTGIVLGINGLSEWMNGDVYIGGFGSYDQARIAHARGGMSSINTYGVGAYAAYFDHGGWYVDGILKYNHYQNTLRAVSTNGLAIEGNYNQWAVGMSFEAGHRFKLSQSNWLQPYAQFTWLKVKGQEIKLSNEMTGNISAFTSLRSEVGLSLGYEFGLGTVGSSLAYITASWLRENKNDNHTMINQHHQFTTDLSGNAGKLGIGLSSLVSKKLKLYAQAHYVKGRKTKQSLQGILGVQYTF